MSKYHRAFASPDAYTLSDNEDLVSRHADTEFYHTVTEQDPAGRFIDNKGESGDPDISHLTWYAADRCMILNGHISSAKPLNITCVAPCIVAFNLTTSNIELLRLINHPSVNKDQREPADLSYNVEPRSFILADNLGTSESPLRYFGTQGGYLSIQGSNFIQNITSWHHYSNLEDNFSIDMRELKSLTSHHISMQGVDIAIGGDVKSLGNTVHIFT